MIKYFARGAAFLTVMAVAVGAHIEPEFAKLDYIRIDESKGRVWRKGSWLDPLKVNDVYYADVWSMRRNGKYYALLGQNNGVISVGVDVIDVTDPAKPIRAGRWYWGGGGPAATDLADVQVNAAGYGAISSDNGGGVFIVDFRAPSNPITLHRIYPGMNCNATPGLECDGAVHNVWMNGDFVYLMHWTTPKLRVFRWATKGVPEKPTYVRTIVASLGSKQFGVHDLSVKGGIMVLSCSDPYPGSLPASGATLVYDVGRGHISGASASNPLFLGGLETGSKTHTNWIADDGIHVYVTRETEGAGVQILKLNGKAAPTKVGEITPAAAGITDPRVVPHNPVVMGNHLYVSWYTEGLQVFDITNPRVPVKVGSHDVYKNPILSNSSLAPYRGYWGVDPFLGNDRILVSDMATGLHVLHLTPNVVPIVVTPILLQ